MKRSTWFITFVILLMAAALFEAYIYLHKN